ncbi:MAG: long-chain acyl-CoA synthetase [Paraglaciecola sp.]|jgi:long-chain acyl-CoA synthetase
MWEKEKVIPDIFFNNSKISLQEFDNNVKKIATVLLSKSLKAGDVIAILLRNDVRQFELIEACRYLEITFVPLNWHSTGTELQHILSDSKASLLIAHADLASAAVSEFSGELNILVYPTPDNILVSYNIQKPDEILPDKRCEDITILLENAVPITTSIKPFRGMFSYTSGSTGRPKGIQRQVNQAQPDLYRVYEGLARTLMQLEKGDRYYITAPTYHSAPNALSLCCFAARDVDIYIEVKFAAEKFLADIERYHITHTYIVPTMMIRLLKLPKEVKEKYNISSLKFAISSGSAWPADVKKAMIDWFGPIFYESYGASEIGFMTLISSDEALEKPGSVGKILPGGSIKIVDDDNNELAVGESGSIYVYLPMFGDFVYTNSAANGSEERYQGHTTVGDIGYLDADGYLYINDRKKDMIISGGANIFPAEIEAAMFDMPQILDCAVFGIPDKEYGEKVVAAVACQVGQSLNLEQLHAFLEGKISRFKHPRQLDLHNSLPREDSGKVFKQRLKARYYSLPA